MVFVPAWCPHAIGNPDAGTGLILLRLQNLPQHAALGSLVREDGGVTRHIYAEPPSAGQRQPSPRRRHEVRIVTHAAPDAPERYSPRQVHIIFSGLILVMLLGTIDQAIVAPALVPIAAEFGGFGNVSWS